MKIDVELIQKRREELGLKQWELGELIGFKSGIGGNQRSMSRIETGRSKMLPYYKFLKICYVLDIDPFDLIIEEEGDFPELEGVVF